MVTGFVTLTGTLLTIILFLIKRKAASNDNPVTQYNKAVNENAKIIAHADVVALNIRLEQLLNTGDSERG